MTGARPGWQPHNPQLPAGVQHPSWQDLADTWPRCRATSFRRFWNGSQWDGSHVANTDLHAIAVCPGCERQTGFVALTIEEEKDYMVGSFESGSTILSNPRKIPKRLLRAWQSKDSIKCIDCDAHVSLCHPASDTTSQAQASEPVPIVAKSSYSTCRGTSPVTDQDRHCLPPPLAPALHE